ncbi:MAG: sigma-54 dependent transcriptional regulator [Thermodesulfovibrionales bacterium]
MAFRILVAEDEEITLKHLLRTLQAEGYEAEGTGNGLEALKKIESDGFDLLIADVKMPGMNGMDLLARVKESRPEVEVIMVTGYGSIGSAVEAMKQGAYDYVPKPFDLDELVLKVGKTLEQKALRRENIALRTFLGMDRKLSIIAESEKMKRILDTIEDIKDSDCSVLLLGESGVGKNLLAKIIHSTSPRRQRPFLSINCATFTEDLLASELFGHEKGAFTGAVAAKPGLVEIADTGTLFLDEIAELPPNLQAKLLKVIEEKEFFRVGGTRPIRVDVRFLASTNQNITRLIADGGFRKDLYYRLNVMEIYIPPLRERKRDIEPLARFFLGKYAPKYNKKITGFSPEAMKVLKGYGFPGNVRELENIVERASILEKGSLITHESLPRTLRMFQIETLEPESIKPLDELTRDYARQVVELVGGNKTEAARLLGISRTGLWRLLKEEE